jgi:hypothetical protein
MNQVLFKELAVPNNFVFQLSYKGPSFEGQISLKDLTEELAGFDYCLNTILSIANREKILDINPYEYEFVVEPFQKGSFKKRIKLVAKTIEKYPASANTILTIALTFVGIGQLIVMLQSNNLQRTLQDNSNTNNIDKIKLELLNDKDFLAAYAKVVIPLSKPTDSLTFVQPNNAEYVISYKDKIKFIEAAGDNIEFETQISESLEGRITRVDLTATKNALGFKVNDTGSTIPCSFLDSINPEERKKLLDKWIHITGITSKVGGERKHIIIYNYQVIAQTEQGVIPFGE